MTNVLGDSAARGPALTKSASVVRLLSRSRGATVTDMIDATGWQAHTVRAFLTGQRKKGIMLLREQRRDGTTCYRIAKGVGVAELPTTPETVDA